MTADRPDLCAALEKALALTKGARCITHGPIHPYRDTCPGCVTQDSLRRIEVELEAALAAATGAPLSVERLAALREAANNAITYLETGCFNLAGAVACAKTLRAVLADAAPEELTHHAQVDYETGRDVLSHAAPSTPPTYVIHLLERIEALTEDQGGELLDIWSGEIPGNWRQQLFLWLTTPGERDRGGRRRPRGTAAD